MFSRLRSLVKGLRGSGSLNQEIDEELRFHLEARTDDLVHRGMSRGPAERQARIELGGAAAHREEVRASHGLRLFDYFRQDIGQVLRSLRRNPGFSLSIVGLIALGVGSNVAIFSVVDAVLFRPPPFAEPDALVSIKAASSSHRWISLPEYQALEMRSDLFTGTAAYVRDLVTVTGGNLPDQVNAIRTTGQLFSVLGVRALFGRMIEESDQSQGTSAAVISHRLWHRQFDGQKDVLGETLSLSGKPFTIAGVMRPEIEFPDSRVDVWLPFDPGPAALVSNLPLSGINIMLGWEGEGETLWMSSVSSKYFRVMDMPLVSGRLFTPDDHADAPFVAIVNEQVAKDMFPGQDAIGQDLPAYQKRESRIVGIVKDSWQSEYDRPIGGAVYFPYGQRGMGPAFASTIVIRTDPDRRLTAEALQQAIWAVDPSQPITRTESMEAIVSDAIWRPRFTAWAFSFLGLIALLLSGLGTYAVVSYTSALRMREVGVRMSVGATGWDIMLLIMTGAMRPLAIGLVIGGLATVSLTQLLSSLLYQTSGWQPEAYLGAVAVMLAASVVASLVPARRAASSDPMSVLRAE